MVLRRVGEAHEIVRCLENDASARGAWLRNGVAEALFKVKGRQNLTSQVDDASNIG